jgi:hypothetical protein
MSIPFKATMIIAASVARGKVSNSGPTQRRTVKINQF